jgi:hypothetical protein
MVEAVKAITIRDPHATAIVYGTKRLVDCAWSPPAYLIGQTIAIHVSEYIGHRERQALESVIRKVGERGVRWHEAPENGWITFENLVRMRTMHDPTPSSIIGVATLKALIGGPTEAIKMGQAVWFTGPMAHVLEDVRPIWPPVKARGHVHYWEVPAHLVDTILSRIKDPA